MNDHSAMDTTNPLTAHSAARTVAPRSDLSNNAPRHRPSLIGTLGSFTRSTLSVFSGTKGIAVGLFLATSTIAGLYYIATRQDAQSFSPSVNGQIDEQFSVPPENASISNNTKQVTVQTAELANVENVLTLTGTVVPKSLLRVTPALSGPKILEMLVQPGDRITPGQPIATLDSSILLSQLAQAEAQLAQAQSAIQSQEAVIAQSRVLQEAATADVRRYAALYEQGAISQEQLGNRQIKTFTAQQNVQVALADLNSAQATIASQQAAIEQINTQLNQTVVTAPTAGTIAERLATVGETAAAENPLYSLIENSALILEINPSQAQLSKIELGMPVVIRVSDASDQSTLTGSVLSIDPTLQSNSRQATVKVALPVDSREPKRSLKAGMFLQADIITSQQKNVVVPAAAVVTKPDGQRIVYTVSESTEDSTTVQANVVEVASRSASIESNRLVDDTDYVSILSGLSADSVVVVSGASYLQSGDRVTVLTESSTVDLLSGDN